MLAWLQEAQSVFQRADKELELITAPIREKYGITEEAIAKVMAEVPRDLSGSNSTAALRG
jgi:hypothetical protein